MPPKSAQGPQAPASLLVLQEQRTEHFLARINQATDQLLSRFTQISALVDQAVQPESKVEGAEAPARPTHAEYTARSLQITNATNAILRAHNDLRRVLYEVKELWVLDHDGRGQDADTEESSAETLSLASKQAIMTKAVAMLNSMGATFV